MVTTIGAIELVAEVVPMLANSVLANQSRGNVTIVHSEPLRML